MTKEEIKEERLKRLWTQEELAIKAGVWAVQISEWESGKRTPSLRSQKKLREAFNSEPIL